MKYLKLFENFNQEITFEDVEDLLLPYIESGDISTKEDESLEDTWFFNLSKPNLFTFLTAYVTCLVKDTKFTEEPFNFITPETDLLDYFKVEKPLQIKDSRSIYFKMVISQKFAIKFLNSSTKQDVVDLKTSLTDSSVIKSIKVKRFIFEILKTIFSRFLAFYQSEKINIFYRVLDTWEIGSSENKPFAILNFRIEFPDEKITESIQVKEFDNNFIDVDILDDTNNKIGSFQLESSDGKHYTIIDALIGEEYRMRGYYRKSIIDLLNQYPDITIVSVFRSEGADRAWKKLIDELPDGFNYTKKWHPEENTLEYKLFKK